LLSITLLAKRLFFVKGVAIAMTFMPADKPDLTPFTESSITRHSEGVISSFFETSFPFLIN
jgi:hypothetical protein